jgi:toxin ParE1/3/4
MSEVVLLLSADLDVQEAFEYYEEHQEGRGAVFLRHLELALEQLRRFPESGTRFHRSYRRLLVPSFPHGVFYVVEARGVIITGVMDTRRDPEAILRRLS